MPDPSDDPNRTRTQPAAPFPPQPPLGSTAPFDYAAVGTDPDDAPPFAPSDYPDDLGRLGRYRVLKRIGKGGMGAVYLGYDEVLHRRLALKVMLPKYAANAVARHRFLREARTAAAVSSEHVVTVLDVDENGGVPFLVMEYLQGTPLDRFLAGTPNLTVPQVVRIGREAARGLAAAHAQGLVHRDIKPANLWLEAPHGRVKLLDFGLAREEHEDDNPTQTGDVLGTPAYMSPEQARGDHLDARSDLFSLGALLYRVATGRLPFAGPTQMAILTALATADPPPVRSLNPDIPAALAALIHRLLAKDPAARPGSADEVLVALAGAETLAVPARGAAAGADAPIAVSAQAESVWDQIDEPAAEVSSVVPAARPAPRSHRRALAASAGGILLLIVGGMAAVWAMTRPPAPKPAPAVDPSPGTTDVGKPPAVRLPNDRAAADILRSHGAILESLHNSRSRWQQRGYGMFHTRT